MGEKNQFQNQFEAMLQYYQKLLKYIKTAVTKNYSEKSINAILDYISTSKQMDLLQKFYETTLDALKVGDSRFQYLFLSCKFAGLFVLFLWVFKQFYFVKDAKNERLWFKTNTKLGKLYFDMREFQKLERILKQLKSSCRVSYSHSFFLCLLLEAILAVTFSSPKYILSINSSYSSIFKRISYEFRQNKVKRIRRKVPNY